VRDRRLKLTDDGRLLDMSDAPFAEKPAADTPENSAARQILQAVLDDLRRQWKPSETPAKKPKAKPKAAGARKKSADQTFRQDLGA
jgi:hypothetical protein